MDFRKLNEMTENEAYSLPNLLEILEPLGLSKYFSTLDLKSGYHQIKIDESDIHKTAFSTKSGHYEYTYAFWAEFCSSHIHTGNESSLNGSRRDVHSISRRHSSTRF